MPRVGAGGVVACGVIAPAGGIRLEALAWQRELGVWHIESLYQRAKYLEPSLRCVLRIMASEMRASL